MSTDTTEFSRKVKHGIKWQAVISIASQVLYFINGVILARILGPKEFGIYGMAQLVSTFVWMFWQLGLNAAIIQRKDIDNAHLDTAFAISLLMGILCAIITWFSAPFIAAFFSEPKVVPLTRVIAFTFIIYSLDRVPSALLSRDLRFKEVAIPGLLDAVVYPIAAIPMALMGFGAMSFVWGVVAGAVCMLIVRYHWLFKYFSWRPKFGFNKKAAKDLLGFGVFLTLSNILSFFVSNIQKIITGRYLLPEDLAYYNRAFNLSRLPILKINSLISSALLPTFSRIQNDIDKTRDWFRKFNFFAYAIATPPLIFFIFFPSLFIDVVFGYKWDYAARLLPITSIGTLICIPIMFWSNIIMAKGYSNIMLYMDLAKLPLLALALFIGVKYGVFGVVLAVFLVGTFFGMPFYVFVIDKYVGVKLYDWIVSAWEAVFVSLVAGCLSRYVWTIFFYRKEDIAIFLVVGMLYAVVVLVWYLIRFFYLSEITYMNFNLRLLIRHV